MTKAPAPLVVKGHIYPATDSMGRLPLRAFLVNIRQLQAATVRTMRVGPNDLMFQWTLHFNSYATQVRKAGKAAKKAWLDRVSQRLDQGLVPLHPRANYSYSRFVIEQNRWMHRFRITCRLTKPSWVDVGFDWNTLIRSVEGQTVHGIYEARSTVDMADYTRISMSMYVDDGAYVMEKGPEKTPE